MENKPTQKPTRRGWFRKWSLRKRIGLGLIAFVVGLFVLAQVVAVFSKASHHTTGSAAMSPEAVATRDRFMGDMQKEIDAGTAPPNFAKQLEVMKRMKAGESIKAIAREARQIAASPAPSGDEYQQVATTSLASLETWGHQLILTGSISLEVEDVRLAFDRVQTLAAAEGALVTNASLQSGANDSNDEGGYASATLVLRMPQDRFHSMRQKLTQLAGDLKGKVTDDEVSSEDVTEEYVDLKARLHNEQSQEIQLLEIMRQARRIPDILSVRNQLAQVQQEIERIQGRLRFLENRVDLSTITVNISQEGNKPDPAFAAAWQQMSKNLKGAWMNSLVNVVALLGYLSILLIYLLPFAVIIAVVWAILRRGRKRALPKLSQESK